MSADAKMTEVKSDLLELESLMKQASRKYVKDMLSLEIRKLEIQLSKLQEDKVTTAVPNTVVQSENKRYQVKLNGYGWDQSDKFIKIFVTLKNAQTVPTENVFCNLTEHSMELHVKDLDNKDYILVINKLLKPINIQNSYWKQKTDMVVVFLAKTSAGTHWSHMTEIEKRFEENKASKFSTGNMDEKSPQDSLMGLMRNMYESGDDDMKRMIKKAWTENQDKQASGKSMDL